MNKEKLIKKLRFLMDRYGYFCNKGGININKKDLLLTEIKNLCVQIDRS